MASRNSFGYTKADHMTPPEVPLPQPSTNPKGRASDQLIAYFERAILDGTLPVGAPLPPEREIVQTHAVSRTVAREAVQALARKGLVQARPGFRPVVSEPGYDAALTAVGSIITQLLNQSQGVRNLFDLRIMMEAALVRQAAMTATAKDIAELEDALAENGDVISDSARFSDTDVAFHAVLYQIPRNPVLPALHRAYIDWLSIHWQKMPPSETRNQQNHMSHQRIFDAILRRDPDKAEAALRHHLDEAWDQISTTFERTTP